MNTLKFTPLLLLFPLMLVLYSCGSSDTVTVVDRTPESSVDSSEDENASQSQDDFMQLNVGLLEPVTNFDPLFADNLSTLRVISLIYDGLFELNDEGDPEPKLVSDTEVSDDGREYQFTINRDIYFHDSNAFSAGVGRRIHAQDIKWAFERAAQVDVPKTAADLLMNIRGFENYFIEQHHVYDPDHRVISEISGIEVVDAETIRFTLRTEDENFLHKLASPYLSIYPREAVDNPETGLKNQPVGTGAYIVNDKSENSVILARNPSPQFTDQAEQFPINRIDFTVFESETDIFQQFARQNIDWIPELGPMIQRQVINDEREIVGSYSGQFNLIEHAASRFTSIFLNAESEQDLDPVKIRLNNIEQDQLDMTGNIQIRELEDVDEDDIESSPQDYYIVYTDNPFARDLFTNINRSIFNDESDLSFLDIRTATPETALFSKTVDYIHNRLAPNDVELLWISVETPIFGIHHSYVEGLNATAVPWKLPVENVNVNESENDNS